MRKVLIITYYFPPLGGAGVQRILKFIKYLPNFNWMPLILTVKNAEYYIKDHTLMEQVTDRENICYTPAILFGRFFRKIFRHNSEKFENINREDSIFLKPIKTVFNFLKKVFYTFVYFPDEYIGWIPFGLIKGYYFIKKKNVDLIISSGPPNSVHIIGYFLKKFTGRKWIVDCRDLWETYNYVYNPFNFKFKIKTEEFFESKVFKYADKIVLASPPWVNQLKKKYHEVDKDKFSVITNGFDSDDFKDIKPKRFEKEFNIVYSGNLYMWRKPDNFLFALNNLIKKYQDFKDDLGVYFIGTFPGQSKMLIDLIELDGFVNIVGYKPYRESLSYIIGADLLLVILGDLPTVKDVIPEKVFDYMGARKPILAVACDGALKDLIEKYSLGKVVNSENIREIENAIYSFYLDFKSKRDIYKPKDCSVFERKYVTKQLSELLNEIIENN